MSTAPPVPPRPYIPPLNPPPNPPPLPPLPPNILHRYNTDSGSLPHFEKPLIAPTPHHAANVCKVLLHNTPILPLISLDGPSTRRSAPSSSSVVIYTLTYQRHGKSYFSTFSSSFSTAKSTRPSFPNSLSPGPCPTSIRSQRHTISIPRSSSQSRLVSRCLLPH